MFRGELSLTMDTKGRLAIPSRYRERLLEHCGGKVVITIGLQNPCLTVYPFPYWQHIEDKLGNFPAFDTKAQAVSHLLIGHAAECDLDSHGRVLIPPSLRKFAQLDKRVKLVGQVRKFELWDEETWTARCAELLEAVPEVLQDPSEALASLVL